MLPYMTGCYKEIQTFWSMEFPRFLSALSSFHWSLLKSAEKKRTHGPSTPVSPSLSKFPSQGLFH